MPHNSITIIIKGLQKDSSSAIELGFENKLSPLLCGFPAIMNLVNKWQSWLDKSGVVGTVPMDISKAFNFLTHELILTKMYACRVHMKGLKLL